MKKKLKSFFTLCSLLAISIEITFRYERYVLKGEREREEGRKWEETQEKNFNGFFLLVLLLLSLFIPSCFAHPQNIF